ncbi:MAG: hypothetical protein ACRD50_16620 [Candidatus Acidiferrales bacterium]
MTLFNRITPRRFGLPRRGGVSWFGIACAAVLISLAVNWPVTAQLQQSGGSGGSNASVSATGSAVPSSATFIGGTDGANLRGISTDSSGNVNVKIQSGTVSLSGAIPAGTNVIGKVIPATACGTTVANQALAAVPTSSTAVFSSTTCLWIIVLNNTTGSSLTVSVTDNQGTPINDVLTFSIPANSQLIQQLGGVQFTSGVKWSASASGVTGAVLGYQ